VTRRLLDYPPEQALDIKGVLAEQEALCVLHHVGNAAAAIGLAEPDRSGVGVNSHEIPLEVTRHDACSDVSDRNVAFGHAIRGVVREVTHRLYS